MGRAAINIILYAILFSLVAAMACGQVVVFSNYETQTTLGDGVLHIHRKLTLQNVGANPIIPGELHFKIHEIRNDEKLPSTINNFKAVNDYDVELKTRQINGNEETDLVVSIWEPVLPKFSYKLYLDYDIVFDPKGMLFYELVVPNEETTIPIQNNVNSIYIPAKYHVTHAPGADVKKVVNGNDEYRMVSWKNTKDMLLEYSVIPLPRLGIRAVNLFWGIIIVATLLLTLVLHKKLR